ncbi:MAG TPA: HAD family hydrolase, partial [Polyangia bacterium]|nr:HAD family hydrolase [Polyangia bacterium]
SLDCFDTLLWRRTAEPMDVFFDMQKSAAFAARGYTARQRALSESSARQLMRVRKQRGEVALADIYRAAFPEIGADELRALAAAELDAEKAACYAFPPVVELIRKAKQKSLRVVVVSDTYFGEDELRALLQSCLPADVYAMIDSVFSSSDHGRGKTEGLFHAVLERLKVPAAATVHLGDNRAADLVAPRAHGMFARLFVQQGDNEAELLRLQGSAASMLLPELRRDQPMPSPFRPVLALTPAGQSTGGDFLGYAGAGPILYSFARFVLDEVAALRAQGKRVKPLFLLRDGHLPQLVCDAVAGHSVGHAMAVSRRVAFASTFRSAVDIERYLSRFGTAERADAIARQLLLNEAETRALEEKLVGATSPNQTMAQWLLRPAMVQTIVERSTAERQKLYRYIERTCGLERGDTLMFIDLGYEGTAQRQLEPVFAEERGVDIIGRYLLASPIPGGQTTRKGLVDVAWCDQRAIATLVRYIAVVENICTSDGGSVIGYTDEGAPITAPILVDRAQLHKLAGVQARCVQFARDCEALFAATGKPPTLQALATTTVA